MDQRIIFGPDKRSTWSITTWAVERIPRELGLTSNPGPYRITAEIVKDGGPVGLGYGVTSLVKWQRSCYINVASDQGSCYINGAVTGHHITLMEPCYSVLWRCPWCNGYRRRKWTRVQILDETDCISHSTNTLGKGMNPIILPPAMGK